MSIRVYIFGPGRAVEDFQPTNVPPVYEMKGR